MHSSLQGRKSKPTRVVSRRYSAAADRKDSAMVSNLYADLRAVKIVAMVPMRPTAKAMSLERIW